MRVLTWTSLLLLIHALPTLAQGNVARAPEWKIGLTVGQGVLENPLAGRSDGETSFLPAFSYYGERFFVSNMAAGFTLKEHQDFYLDLVVRPNEDGLYYHLNDDSVTMGNLSSFLGSFGGFGLDDIDRDISVMGGASGTLVTRLADISLGYFHDISEVHYGNEIHLNFGKRHNLFGGALYWELGAIKKDADLVNYYYSLTEAEAGMFARSFQNQFPADDVTDQYTKLHYAYPLGKGWALQFAARYSKLDLDGRNPLMIDKPETLSWLTGLQYSFGSAQ